MKKTIIITLEGGLIQEISGFPDCMRIVVREFAE